MSGSREMSIQPAFINSDSNRKFPVNHSKIACRFPAADRMTIKRAAGGNRLHFTRYTPWESQSRVGRIEECSDDAPAVRGPLHQGKRLPERRFAWSGLLGLLGLAPVAVG